MTGGLWIIVALATGGAPASVPRRDLPTAPTANADGAARIMQAYHARTQVASTVRCRSVGTGDSITVCGRRPSENRLPLPRESAEQTGIVPGEVPRASAASVRQGGCGTVGGQLNGCFGGVPIVRFGGVPIAGGDSALTRFATTLTSHIANLDIDLAPPPLPDKFRDAGVH